MHIQGETDRGCGLLFWADDQDLSVGEISPLILLTVAVRYTKGTRLFELLNPNIHQLLTGQVRLGKATDHLQAEVQPVGSQTANVFFRINDHTAFMLDNKPAVPGKVGFEVDDHAVQVGFDSFEFGVLNP